LILNHVVRAVVYGARLCLATMPSRSSLHTHSNNAIPSRFDAADPAVDTKQQKHVLAQLLHAGSTSPSETSPPAEPALAHQQPGITGSSSFFEDVSVPQLTWLILKNGTSYLARDYGLEAGKLVCVTLDWDRSLLPLARLDLDETVRLNRERNVEFVILLRDR